jgi:hypothetical protein
MRVRITSTCLRYNEQHGGQVDQFITVAFGLIVLAASAIADLIKDPTFVALVVAVFMICHTVHSEKEALLRDLTREIESHIDEIENRIDGKLRKLEQNILNSMP